MLGQALSEFLSELSEVIRIYIQEETCACIDCRVNTGSLGEYYMVHDAVWNSAVPEPEGMLCIGCLEERLKRQLTKDDFIDCELNGMNDSFFRSERFLQRLGLA